VASIDEPGPPVIVGEREKEALARYFDSQPDVVAGYLFGSQARGQAGPLSDVDLAVWLDPASTRRERWRRQEELTLGCWEVLHTGAVQLIVLNDAPPLLAHRVLREQQRLADRDPQQRVRLETDAMLRYLDTIWLREEIGRGVARRIEKGAFGRPRRA
jgi:predicted nucleotidyltransferase